MRGFKVRAGLVFFIVAFLVPTMGPTARAQECDGIPQRPSVTAPADFVQSEPWNWSLQVAVPAYEPACPVSVILEVSEVELNVGEGGVVNGDPINFDEDLVKKVGFGTQMPNLDACRRCRLQVQSNRPYDVELSARGTATVRIPNEVGPGRIIAKVTAVGREGSASSDPLSYLLTASAFAAADHEARQNMLEHADKKEREGSTGQANDLRRLSASRRQYLRYEESTGGDRLVEVFGDLVTANQVVVSVPGLGQEAVLGHRDGDGCKCVESATWVYNAERVWQRSAVVGGADSTAVIAYLGYDAPNFKNVGSDNAAKNGAGELKRDLESWGLDGDGADRLVLVGHSYGSLVAGIALGRGAGARDVVLAGSPGVDIEDAPDGSFCANDVFLAPEGGGTACCPEKASVSCYELVDSSHTWVLRFDGDPVTRTYAAFGIHPDDDSFGAIEMHTEPPQCDQSFNGMAPWDTKCHSRYFNWGQKSLDNLTAVVLGKYSSASLVGKNPKPPKNMTPGPKRDDWPVIGAPAPTEAASTDPEVFLQQFLDQWQAGWPNGSDQFADPDVIESMEVARDWVTYELIWDDLTCPMGSSGSGGCRFVGLNEHGYGNSYSITYGEVDASGTLRVYGVIDDGPGD